MKSLIKSLAESKAGYGALALRLPIGIIFMAHGAQKLFGWFGGYGLAGNRTVDGFHRPWPWHVDGWPSR